MSHIERRANLWYATLTIPKDVRGPLGKFKFIQSLGTSDKREASILAAPVLAHWKAQIREARGHRGAIVTEASRWKAMLSEAGSPVQSDVIEELLLEKAEEIEKHNGTEKAQEFFEIAHSRRTPSNTLHGNWVAQLSVAEKTKDQFIKDVDLLLKRFGSLEGITRQSVKKWIDDLTSQGSSENSVNRILTACRNYWRYLQRNDLVSVDNEPFKNLLPADKAKRSKSKNGWTPFQPSEVVELWSAASVKADQQLSDLILLAAYTGARIEELCSIKIENVTEQAFKIVDAKTDAGIREVPIHSKLKATIGRLKADSKDGYLISGLSFSKYEDRSNALGKRFGRLKSKMGFNSKKVFHSLRKTLVTLLENAGVTEGVTADIVGHEKQTMTYGLYSGGNSLAVKREAIEKAVYPF